MIDKIATTKRGMVCTEFIILYFFIFRKNET